MCGMAMGLVTHRCVQARTLQELLERLWQL